MCDSSWPHWLRKMLCKLYGYWGESCNKLGETEHEWVVTITETYAQQGTPQFAEQAAVDEFLADLDDLEAGLDDPGDTLSELDREALFIMIDGLRHDLGQLQGQP